MSKTASATLASGAKSSAKTSLPFPARRFRRPDPVLASLLLAGAVLCAGTALLSLKGDPAVIGVATVTALFANAALWLAWRALTRQSAELAQALQQVGAGNCQQSIQKATAGALAPAWAAAEAVSVATSKVVAQVKSEGVIVASEGKALLERASDLAARTEQQAAGLEQSVAAVEELTVSVGRSAQAVSEVDKLATQVRSSASLAQIAMTEAVAGVSRISAGTSRVGETVAVIDAIAFQTNLLALNAGVEAARAGDAGRGFAVVASEVRALATRCANSAAEVREVMKATETDVRQGIATLSGAEQRLTEIVGAIGRLSTESSAIAKVAREQGDALAQVSEGLKHVDHATQYNAALVERTARSAEVLTEKAGRLAQSVAHARLRQGTADEAYAMVQRAVERMQAVGRERALREFHDAAGEFVDRDLYLILSDRVGRYLAISARPAMLGRNMSELPNFDAASFLADANACANAGGGWIEYEVLHPGTGTVQEKISWYESFGNDLLIGCGVFKNLIVETTATR